MPASMTRTSTPDSRNRSRRNAYSRPFVSSVPTRTIVATTRAPPAARRRGSGAAAPCRSRAAAAVVSAAIVPATITSCRSAIAVAMPRFCSITRIDKAFLVERLERLDQVLDDRRREPLGRLVHDQQRRVRQQRAADRKHLLLATRELRAAVPAALGETREELVDALDRPPLRAAAAPGDHAQVLVDRQGREQPAPLGHVADPQLRDLVRRPADKLSSLEADRPGDACRRHADDRVAQRRLAHPVAADHRGRAAGDLERHVLERLRRPVERVQVLDHEQRSVSHRRDSPARDRGRGRSGSRGSRRAFLRRSRGRHASSSRGRRRGARRPCRAR